jgi:hypothetical protein
MSGNIPQCRARSRRNRGRLHVGMVGEIISERWARSARNQQKDRLARVKTVIISPDGPLNALPFDALLKENGERLLNLYPV